MKTIMWFGFVLGALSAAGEVILTRPGQAVTLECGIGTGGRLVWRRGSLQIFDVDGKSGFNRKGKGDLVQRSKLRRGRNLEIEGAKEGDAGKFSCEVDGKTHEHTLLVVTVSASPSGALQLGSEATLQCQVNGLDSSSAVQWKRPDGGPPVGSDIVHLKSVARSDAGTWNCAFALNGAAYKESLDIKVEEPAPETPAAVPPQGSPDASQPASPGSAPTSPSDAALPLGLSWWVWVAIGVGCLLVALLTVFVILLCKKIRRRKLQRKLQKMKHDRELLKSRQYCQCKRPAAAAKPRQGRRKEKPSALPLQPC